jgi:mannose-6-phosphate isomerase-like protein (cupin superfamily)
MRALLLSLPAIAFLIASGCVNGFAQAPKDGVYISNEDIKAVLQRALDTKRTSPDNAIRVIDMGDYQLGVAVIHRGALGVNRAANAGGGGNGNTAQPAPAANPSTTCGDQRPDATGPNGILHDFKAESYVVISGNATLITGGSIVNGKRSAPDNDVTTTLNGPSCSGTMVGYTSREIKPGDVIIIPEGVPHGFSAIPDQITYLSIRPDLKKVLQHGYVNPALSK